MPARQQEVWVWNSGEKAATDVYLRVVSMEMLSKPETGWHCVGSEQHEKGTDFRTGWGLSSRAFHVWVLTRWGFRKEVDEVADVVQVPPGESTILKTKKEWVSGVLCYKPSPSANSLGSTFNIHPECDLLSPPPPPFSPGVCKPSSTPSLPTAESSWSLCFHSCSRNSLLSTQKAGWLF